MRSHRYYAARAARVLASSKFFKCIVALFVLQAAWIALSGRYPMAFDEDYHLGIIRLYAHHLSPFWSQQPPDADRFGALARDPSFLYQYVMSFPYRLISVFTSSQTAQVIILRFINIGLLAASLPLFRRLLIKSGTSRAVTHSALLLFVLLPIVPLLGAQINYDNAMIPLVAILLLLAGQCLDALQVQRPLGYKLAWVLGVGLIGCLIKYPFLPIFAAVVLFLLIAGRRAYGSWRAFGRAFAADIVTLSRLKLVIIGMVLLVSAVLAGQRYGINLVRYHTPVPDCGQVLTVAQCSQYGPWNRDFSLSQSKSADAPKSPVTFTHAWFYGMWLRTFFAVDGPGTNFQTRGPLVLPAIFGIVFPAVTAAAAIICGRRLLQSPHGSLRLLSLCVGVFYILVLWLDEYRAFLHTGHAVAINGRYLLPIVLPLTAFGLQSLQRATRRFPAAYKMFVAASIIAMLWGGGALTYVLRSNDAWLWPNTAVTATNRAVRNTLGPITPGYHRYTQFLH